MPFPDAAGVAMDSELLRTSNSSKEALNKSSLSALLAKSG